MSWYEYRRYVPVAERRANAAREMAKLAKKGHPVSPVRIEGRKIATTFWGTAWCENLESYSDFANRLPRGRTYVRNGSVVDLQIAPGEVTARVSGSELYEVRVRIKPLSKAQWKVVSSRCAGRIGSVLELLQGRLSEGVMEIITDRREGLFPKPAEIELDCSCPDWADMCKHVAAVLYGIGARLDEKPELLFVLRQVDHMELIEHAAAGQALTPSTASDARTIAEGDLADVFGIELDTPADADPAAVPTPLRKTPARQAPAASKAKSASKAPAKTAAKKTSRKASKRRKAAGETSTGQQRKTGRVKKAQSSAPKPRTSKRNPPPTAADSTPEPADTEKKRRRGSKRVDEK